MQTMTYDEALRALESIAQNIPNRPSCLCCGYEHNCDRDGCNLLEQVKAVMEQLHKDCEGQCLCCIAREVDCEQEPCNSCGGPVGKWQWRGVVEQPPEAQE